MGPGSESAGQIVSILITIDSPSSDFVKYRYSIIIINIATFHFLFKQKIIKHQT